MYSFREKDLFPEKEHTHTHTHTYTRTHIQRDRCVCVRACVRVCVCLIWETVQCNAAKRTGKKSQPKEKYKMKASQGSGWDPSRQTPNEVI